MDALCRTDARYRDDEPTQFIHSVEGLLERRLTRDVRVIRVRKNRMTDLLTPTVVAEPRNPDAWVLIDRALLVVWMALVIDVV